METLINRIRVALAMGLSGREIAIHFNEVASPEEVWLAYMAAKILMEDDHEG